MLGSRRIINRGHRPRQEGLIKMKRMMEKQGGEEVRLKKKVCHKKRSDCGDRFTGNVRKGWKVDCCSALQLVVRQRNPQPRARL